VKDNFDTENTEREGSFTEIFLLCETLWLLRALCVEQNVYIEKELYVMKKMYDTINQLTHHIIGAAIEVHRILGPGLLESTYEACMVYELRERGLQFKQQLVLPVVYKDIQLEQGYRIDLLVENRVVVELKAVAELLPVHEAQILSYLKLSGHKIGLLLNFNVTLLKDGGIQRYRM